MKRLYGTKTRLTRAIAGAWIGLLFVPFASADRSRPAARTRTTLDATIVGTSRPAPVLGNTARDAVRSTIVIENARSGDVVARRGDQILSGNATIGNATIGATTGVGFGVDATTADAVTPSTRPNFAGDLVSPGVVTTTNVTSNVTTGSTTLLDPFAVSTTSSSTLVQSTLTGPFNQSTTPSAVLMNGIAPVGTVVIETVPLAPSTPGDAIQADVVTSPVTQFSAPALTVGSIPNLPAGSTPSLPVGAIPHLPAGSTLPVAVGAPIGTIIGTPGSPTVTVTPVFVNGTTNNGGQ